MYSLGACIMQNKNKTFQSYMYAVIWCVIAIFIDQITKWLVVHNLKEKDSITIIPNVFELHYLENRGAAFGMLQNKQIIFLIGASIVLIAIGYLYGKIPHMSRYFWLRFCAVLVCAGAIGNMIDRIRLNYVIDFFYFSLIDFPIFNVADCYVVVACVLFAILVLFYYKDEDFAWISRK
jgi:signal peptidase II